MGGKALRGEFIFLIFAEIFFLALVAAGVGLLVIRRRLRRERERSGHLSHEVAALRQRLELIRQNLHAANDKIKALQDAQQQKNDPLLLNYQQRIANLEKFKDLYFELEERLLRSSESDGEQGRNGIESQEKIESPGAEESARYRERVRELETTERRLQEELVVHTRRIQDLEARQSSAPLFGAVRIKEVEEMNQRLKERESEIRRLRQECETIGVQYEELAAKSLELASGRDDLSDEQKAQLETLKQSLEENSAALARKQAECEMLENYYLELEQTAQSNEAATRMQQSYAERNTLQQQRRDLSGQVEFAANPEAAVEMSKLRDTLAEKESALNDIRKQYREIKEQFVAVAEEEDELRSSNELLKQECDALRHELAEIKTAHQQIADEKKELERLRAEYSKMESRYLALVKKVQ